MRYEHKRGWWVEIEGACDLPMAELIRVYNNMYEAWGILTSVVTGSSFVDRHGEEFSLTEDREATGLRMSTRQRHWLIEQLRVAVLDEIAPGEA